MRTKGFVKFVRLTFLLLTERIIAEDVVKYAAMLVPLNKDL